jgi:TPP-dependent pyruvate/acetoin dehydrogenase alpha subunit
MLKCRLLDDRIKSERVRNFKLQDSSAVLYHPHRGREAASVGVVIDLVDGDTVASPPGNLIPLYLNGMPLEELFASLSPPTRPASAPSPWLDRAIAAALANKTSSNRKIAVAFHGPDAAARRSWELAIEHASLQTLPIIFVSSSQQPLKAQPAGCPAIPVDGHDVVAVYRVAFESIARARAGRGPTLIECRRWQSADAVHNRDNNPIHNMEMYLTRKGLFTPAVKAATLAGFRKELDAAIPAARK